MNLLSWLERALSEIGERPRQVLGLRLGLSGDPLTLGRIGGLMGLTRERVRQLEGKGLKRLGIDALWFLDLEEDLFQLLSARTRALSLLGAEEVENRLWGVGRRPTILAYLLQKLGPKRIHLTSVTNVTYLMDLQQSHWDQWLSQCRRNLRSVAWAGWSEARCHDEVLALKPDVMLGTGDLLWQVLREKYVFEGISSASSLVPTTLEQAVRQILTETSVPLHYRDYLQPVRKLLGREVSDKSLQNAVARAGILLGRGIYGLPKHIKVQVEDRKRVVEAVEARISSQATSRQWHTGELMDWLQLDLGPVSGLDKFILDILLRDSNSLQGLGRLVWQMKESEENRLERINIQEAVIDILKECGRPMTKEAIHERLVQKRGVGRNFQVHPSDRVKHVGQNLWGLHDWQEETPLFDLNSSEETKT